VTITVAATGTVSAGVDWLRAFSELLGVVLWPILIGCTIVLLLPEFKKVLRDRSWTIKVGDKEITVQDVSNQLASQVNDLLDAVRNVEQRMKNIENDAPYDPAGSDSTKKIMSESGDLAKAKLAAPSEDRLRSRRLLWCDDQPANNAFLAEKLRNDGYYIREVLSTREALDELACSENYHVVITDMGRVENDRFVPSAGLELAKKIRESGLHIPIFFFTSHRGLKSFHESNIVDESMHATTSGFALFKFIEDAFSR